MDGVEEANRAAVESCTKLVALLARSGDPFRPVPAAAETDMAVAGFGKVVAVLSDRLGHARARVGKRKPPPPSAAAAAAADASWLMDHPALAPCHAPNGGVLVSRTPATPPPPPKRSVAPTSCQETAATPPAAVVVAPCASVASTPAAKFDRSMFMETPLLELNPCSVLPSTAMAVQKNISKLAAVPAASPCAAAAAATPTHIQFQKQQQAKKQRSFQFDQTPGGEQFHIEVPVPLPRGSGGGGGGACKEVISFSFDNNSVCTSSAATSFFTSISSQLISMSDAATSSAALSSKKACARRGDDGSGGKCHCPKKKKPRDKRVVRVPAISDKNADIPADNYSWRKYGQKPIKGSPHPRGYYRCSSKKDCPARKHVERCRSDPAMLIVTYENDHNHAQPLDPSVLAATAAAAET